MNSDNFKVMLTNCDSYLNKRDELYELVKDIEPKVIILTEILPKHPQQNMSRNEFRISGYEVYINSVEKGRGVAIHIQNTISATLVEELAPYNFDESVWCSINLKNSDKLLIGGIYRSPNSSKDNNRQLNIVIKAAVNLGYSHILIAGDFNFRDIEWSTIECTSSIMSDDSIFIENIRDVYLTQHIVQPTRHRAGQQDSCLDLVFTNEDRMVDNVEYLPSVGVSDHLLLIFDYVCYIPTNQRSSQRPNYFKADYVAMNETLTDCDWGIDDSCSAEEMWCHFSTKINTLIDTFVPLTTDKWVFRKPWMSRKTAETIDRKRRAWVKYRNCKSHDNWEKYTKVRNEATGTIRYEKREYERNIAIKVKSEPKLFWKYVKSQTKTKDKISDLMKEDGTLTSSNKEKAEILNTFFSSVFTRESLINVPTLPDRSFDKMLSEFEITEETVYNKLKKLNVTKSPGPDGFHNKLLFEIKNHIIKPLTVLFNKSLNTGQVPKQWKSAYVAPIFKKGDKKKAENYRPVSLTCVICKLLESIVKDHLMSHMEENSLFSVHQFGFRSGHSCVTQLLSIFEEWSKALDNHEKIDVIYLDFRKAFDTVPHQRLANKLFSYGIRGKVLEWIRHFLSDRKQRVVIDNQESNWADVMSGIPQGSVLGPTLFLVFINDLPDIVNNLMKIFADDTKIYSTVRSDEDCIKLQEDLNNLLDWSNTWDLKFNSGKCKSMHIGRNNENHKYHMSDTEILQVDSECDLGIIFQKDLKFTEQVRKCVNKANSMLGIIKRTFSYIDKDMFLLLYKTLVRPHMEYGTAVWSPYLQKDIFLIENVQRRASKLVDDIKHLEYEERMNILGLPTLRYRRERCDQIQVYKIIHEIDKLDKELFFNMNTSTRTRGHNYKISKRQNRTQQRASIFSQRVVNEWNSLPRNCVESETVNSFKSNLNTAWKDHRYKFTM